MIGLKNEMYVPAPSLYRFGHAIPLRVMSSTLVLKSGTLGHLTFLKISFGFPNFILLLKNLRTCRTMLQGIYRYRDEETR